MKGRKPTPAELRRQERLYRFRIFAKSHGLRFHGRGGTTAYKSAFLTETDVRYKDFDHTTTFQLDIYGGVKAIGYDVHNVAEPANDYVDEKGWIAALDAANAFLASKGGKWWDWSKGAFEDTQVSTDEVSK